MKNYIIFSLLSFCCLFFSCGEYTERPNLSVPMDSSLFAPPKDMGLIESNKINEASGLVLSKANPHQFWTHNDSGGAPILYLIDKNGKTTCEWKFANIEARDWEDITLGYSKKDSLTYLYIGEIGDNNTQYEINYLYKTKEILATRTRNKNEKNPPVYKYTSTNNEEIETLSFVYPDGQRDAECLMFDPITEDIFIVTKREENVHFYAYRYPQSTNKVDTLEKIATLPYYKINAGDISADGMEVLIKDYDNIYYWKRKPKQSIDELLQTQPVRLPYKKEPQGEAIAWGVNGEGFYTVSEERNNIATRLYFYERK